MNCKFCNALIDDDTKICPECGKDLCENTEKDGKKKSAAPLVLSIIAAVAALLCLAVVLLLAMGVDFKDFLPRENDIMNKDTYAVTDDEAKDSGDAVIATIEGKELTNSQLQIYFRMQYVDLLNYYGSYVSQIGLDTGKPLSQQPCYFDANLTWEQYLIKIAIETWQNYQTIGMLAEEAGFELDAEYQDALAEMPKQLLTQAEQAGFATADDLIADVIGPSCNLEEYMEYVRLAFISEAYYNTLNEKNIPTVEETNAYYEENKETLETQGITKDMGNVASVRHILVCPDGGKENEETGAMEYSDAEWEACHKAAEKILEEWKAGEATEDSFAMLASRYTEDTGSAEIGGLYEDIAPGSNYVENFLNWSIAMDRQVGETAIVETEYGCHIMYYVSGEPYWTQVVETQIIADRITAMTDEAEAKWPLKVDYTKIEISEIEF